MKLKSLVFTAVSIFTCNMQAPHAMADLTITDHGKSNFTVIIPADAPVSVQNAAQELQKDIEIATGVKLPLQKDNSVIVTPIISLGDTQQAKTASLSSETLADESFHIVTKNGNVYILGSDTPDGKWTTNGGASNGTANGVYTFLEDYLGVRWLMPGDLGRDVPVENIFAVPLINRTETPVFSWRKVTHLGDYADGTQLRNILQWTDHQKLGGATRLDYDANWWRAVNDGKGDDVNTAAVKELYTAHPDWFAMDASGNRPYPKNYYAKWETTNPGMVSWFAEKAIETLKNSPRPRTFSLSPSDGRGWSQSPESKALYDPSPSTLYDPEATPGKPGMSSLVLQWYHDVAQIVAREYPQGRLTGYLYADYLYPPTKIAMKLPDNFMPVIAPSFDYGYGLYRKGVQEQFQYVMGAWAKVIPGSWFYYDLPDQFISQHEDEIGAGNFPGSTAIVSSAASDILNIIFPTLVKDHIKGTYIYGVPSWSNGALTNYLLAKLEWNPRLNADDLQREWLNRAYGLHAGEVMEQFYEKLNGWVGDYYRTHPQSGDLFTLDMLKNIYAAHYEEMEKLFLQAKSQPMTNVQQQRLNLIGDNLIVLQWRLRNAGFLQAGLNSSLQRGNGQVIDLLNQYNADFPLFPGLVPAGNYPQPVPPQWKVQLGEATQVEQKNVSGLSEGMFLIYAARDGQMRIVPHHVTQGAYFASYQLMDASAKPIEMGILNEGTPIVWSARANTAYYLYIPPRKPVNYELSIDNAVVADGSLQHGLLTLSDKSAPFYVFYVPQGTPIGAYESGNSVILKKPYSGSMAKAIMGDAYTDTRVLHSFDEGWRFSPDPQNDGLQRGVINADFDDTSWKTLTGLDWWQMQGFPDYHGAAWYRIKFMAQPLPKTDRARLYFGGVDGNTVVYLNGKKIFDHILGPGFKNWDQPFSGDVTSDLLPGENTLVVQVTSKSNDTASGIFKGAGIVAGTR